MKLYKFSVYFIGAMEEVVTAGCPTDAVILACANRIKKGFHREAYQVTNHDTNETFTLSHSKTLQVNYV